MLGGAPVEIRIEITEKVQQLHHVHPPGQIRPLRQIGHQLLGLRPRGMAVDGDNAAAGDQQAVGQLDQGGLAAAVGAQKPHDAPGLHRQTDVVQGQGAVEIFGQLPAFQNRHVTPPSIPPAAPSPAAGHSPAAPWTPDIPGSGCGPGPPWRSGSRRYPP